MGEKAQWINGKLRKKRTKFTGAEGGESHIIVARVVGKGLNIEALMKMREK